MANPLRILAERLDPGDCPASSIAGEPDECAWTAHRKCESDCDSDHVECWARWAEWKAVRDE